MPALSDDGALDIHGYPPSDLLKLLAHILTHIATTNDQIQHSHYSNPSSPTSPVPIPPIWHSLTTAARSALSNSSSTLTFHARNVPTISLEAYLLRILKYCPTSNSVFLSLLVYFDRMSKLSLKALNKPFIIDSFNIHRLVIAGITVASKFFSDIFYTNSRYAKVGGLPLGELNQLELQFLLLNDFRLYVSSRDMQKYAEQLVVFAKQDHLPSAPILTLPNIPLRRSSSATTTGLNGHGHTHGNHTHTHPSPSPSRNGNGNGNHRSYPSPTSSPSPTPSPEPQLQPQHTRLPIRPTSRQHPHCLATSYIANHNNNNHVHNRHAHTSYLPSSSPPSTDPSDTDTDQDVEDSDAATETDAETTVSSTSTDTDDEPTIRGPRTIIGWNEGDRSP